MRSYEGISSKKRIKLKAFEKAIMGKYAGI